MDERLIGRFGNRQRLVECEIKPVMVNLSAENGARLFPIGMIVETADGRAFFYEEKKKPETSPGFDRSCSGFMR